MSGCDFYREHHETLQCGQDTSLVLWMSLRIKFKGTFEGITGRGRAGQGRKRMAKSRIGFKRFGT